MLIWRARTTIVYKCLELYVIVDNIITSDDSEEDDTCDMKDQQRVGRWHWTRYDIDLDANQQ